MAYPLISTRGAIATVPLRIDIAGGPSDVKPFSEVESGTVVAAAITLAITVSVKPNPVFRITDSENSVECESPEILFESESTRLIGACLLATGVKQPASVAIHAPTERGAGLGGSAALAVALLAALHQFKGDEIPGPNVLAREALDIELEYLRNTAGGQDHYIVALGGVRAFSFSSKGIGFLSGFPTQHALTVMNASILLCFSGRRRRSGSILEPIMRDYAGQNSGVGVHLRRLRDVAVETWRLLQTSSDNMLIQLGELVNAAWESQKALSAAISTAEIEAILQLAKSAGAIGGKVCGAGGGGYVLLVCPSDCIRVVTQRLENCGFMTQRVAVAPHGIELA